MKKVRIVLVFSLAFVCCAQKQNKNYKITLGSDRIRRASAYPVNPPESESEGAYPVRKPTAYLVNPPESKSAQAGAYPVRNSSAYPVNSPESESEGAYPVRQPSAYPVNSPESESEGAYPVRKPSAYLVNPPESDSERAYPVRKTSAYPVNSPESESERAYPVRKPSAYLVNPAESDSEGAYPVRKTSAYPVNSPESESEGAYPVRKTSAYPVNSPEAESESEGAYPVRRTSAYPVNPPKSTNKVRITSANADPPKPESSSQDQRRPQPTSRVPSVKPLSNNAGHKPLEQTIPTVSFKKDYSIYNLDNTLPVLESYEGENCENSLTSVQNEKICKGQLLFYDEFDSLSPKKWSNDIRIPTKPDYEFVTYIQNKNNCYIDDSKLVIKPTLLSDWSDDQIVEYGRVILDNCQIVGHSGTCDKTADKFKILPPVLSAKVRTKQSFNFKYGRIEIKAKLPSGDWVYPQIWLEPKISAYGPHYVSGRIVLGMARGNDILTGEDKTEYGCKEINAGCLYRHDSSLTVNTYLNKVNAKGWHQEFHNYTLLWTPDALEYFVDGESLGKCKTPNSERQQGIWWKGGSVAPFDKDFHISLGVGVGGMSDFPDKTTNGKDAAPKPWRNGEVKAVLKFFQDQDTWSKTWSDNTALRVDSIKVYAI